MEEVYADYPIRYDRCRTSCLHAHGISDLPMGNGHGLQHMCHTQNMVPSSALQRELKKKEQQKKTEEKPSGEGDSAPGETGEAKAAAEPVELPDRDMIPYLVFYRDVTDEQFQQLVSQLKPWGVPLLVYHRRDNMRHLDTWGQKGFYMGLGSGSSMDRVFLGAGGSRAVKQFRLVLVPPAYAQQHAMPMHPGHQHVPPELYDRAETEAAGDAFAIDEWQTRKFHILMSPSWRS